MNIKCKLNNNKPFIEYKLGNQSYIQTKTISKNTKFIIKQLHIIFYKFHKNNEQQISKTQKQYPIKIY